MLLVFQVPWTPKCLTVHRVIFIFYSVIFYFAIEAFHQIKRNIVLEKGIFFGLF